MIIKRLLVSGLIVLLFGCEAKNLVVDQVLDVKSTPEGIAAPLSDEEFQNLKPVKQYQVANKLAATIYKGVPADEFFNFNIYGSELRTSESGSVYLSDMRSKISRRVQNKGELANLVSRRHTFNNDTRQAKGKPLATIIEYPVSRDQFEAWMAYVLANTILFSPAEEIASAGFLDVQKVNDNLVKSLSEDASIRNIVLAHMKSPANWRRFRSPEDNTREMIEIYLGLFDKDADVPKASIACKNWYLTDDSKGDAKYQLVIDFSEQNTEPQKVLDSWVTTCEDFYDVISNHPLLIPRITTFLVDHFFANASSAVRGEIVKDIVAQSPERFHDIFTAIIFSREYLINSERPKSFEEAFFNIADRVGWRNNSSFLDRLVSNDSVNPTLKSMNQPTMTLKLGRFMNQPFDSLSFAFYHKAIRERILTKINTGLWGPGWDIGFYSKGDLFEQEGYIDFLFLSILSRKATQEEIDALSLAFVKTNNELRRDFQAEIVFDYISRLPDLYYYKTITKGDIQ